MDLIIFVSMTLRTVNFKLPDQLDFEVGTQNLRPLSVTAPFCEAIYHFKEAFSHHHKMEQAPSLRERITHFFVGTGLLIPLINLIVFIALKALRPLKMAQPTPFLSRTEKSLPISKDPEGMKWAGKIELDPPLAEWLDEGRVYWPLRFDRFFGGTILHVLAKMKAQQNHLIRVVLKGGVDPSLGDLFGNTALISAIANASNTSAMEIIKNAPCNSHLNVQSKIKGNRALHVSVGKGYTSVSKDGDQLEYSNIELTKAMLSRGADPNIQNSMGNTPLHLACLRRDVESIECLIQAGAKLGIKNKEGKSAEELIDVTYETANKILADSVTIFLLDEKEFESNREKVLSIFKV